MFKGRVWLLGDDIDTDIIMPTEYLALKSIDDMKPYAFSPLRPELAGQIKPGDIILILRIPIQAADQSEQDDTVFHVLEPFSHRGKVKHYLPMRQIIGENFNEDMLLSP